MISKRKSLEDPFSLEFTVTSFQDKYAVLKNQSSDLKELFWPIRRLPENINVGDKIILKAVTIDHEKDAEYERMRKLLEELVN